MPHCRNIMIESSPIMNEIENEISKKGANLAPFKMLFFDILMFHIFDIQYLMTP